MVSPNHVGVVELLQPPQQSHFSDRGDREAILIRLHADALQRHELPALRIPGLINRPVSAAADLRHWLVLDTGAVGHFHSHANWGTNQTNQTQLKK